MDQAGYDDLLQFAKKLAVAIEEGDESLLLATADSVKDWIKQRGLVSFWGVLRERDGHCDYLDGWWLRDDEEVMDYVERDRQGWDLRAGDALLVYRDYRHRSPGQPLFTIPVEPEEQPAPAVDVSWKDEGF